MPVVKQPLPKSELLLEKVQEQLGPDRKPLLIAIDGADGIGKSSLASWLAWQLGMPAVHLDFYIKGSTPFRWTNEELARLIDLRVGKGKPVIVEGIFILDALDQIERKYDFLVWVRGESNSRFSNFLNEYCGRQSPEDRAQFSLDGYDERLEIMECIRRRDQEA